MQDNIRFSVYNHRLVLKDNQLISRKFIVMKDPDGTITFTDFHRYIKSGKNNIRNISDDGNNRYDFIVKLLNYAFFERGIKCLDDLEIAIIKDFLNAYGTGDLPGDKKGRIKSTVEKCVTTILDFLEEMIKERKGNCRIKAENLYKYVPYRNHYGQTVKKKVPVFDVVYVKKCKAIFRDIPNDAFNLLFEHIAVFHKEIFALVFMSAFAGLRPSEACNVRREDSALGAGILFEIVDGEVMKVQIDLRKELCLRSDLLSTGNIKKERMLKVPFLFTDVFVDSYNKYMTCIEGKKYEKDYGPLSINKQGNAMTYDSYYQKFVYIIKQEMIPIYLASGDPEIVLYGRILMENNLSPHVFRHWYTVQLVLSGVDNVAELMEARGDSSPESSLTYLQNKGDLEKKYRKISNEMFDYFSWKSNKQHEGGDI